jgi:hypothetical protein
MSSGPWEKNDEPGIFGGHSDGLRTSGQDMPGTGPMDGDLDWNELEKEYYEDFDHRIAAPVEHQYKYEDQSSDKKKTTRRTHKHVQEEWYHDQGTEVNGKPYHEETMKVTGVRRGGQKRLKNPFANGSSNSFSGGTKIAPYSKSVDCPESGCEVCFSDCLRCESYQVWHDKDDGLRRCYHEYIDLESRGHYDGTWDDHPENFDDPDDFERIQERKQRNEEINRKMELEREELKRMAEEFEKGEEEMRRSIDSDYDEYLKGEYGEYEDERDHEDEEEGEDEDENEDDYDEEEEDDEDEDDVEDDYGDDGYGEDDEYDYGEDLDQ